MENLNVDDYYNTSDMGLAAALVFLGYGVQAIDDTTHRNRVEFVFKRDEKLDEFVERFFKRELSVEPLGFFDSLKHIKSWLYRR
ncbi:hypothetical protein IH979_01365 [Patescibacteria group bacterium]|nr:hypothetical protein [Patescibacteria group bacterium]